MTYSFVIDTDQNGEYIWSFKAPNGNEMMRGTKTYARRDSILAAVALIALEASGAGVIDNTAPALLRGRP